MKKTRVDEVLNRLERMGLDQIIITDANSIFYLTVIWVDAGERLVALYLSRHKESCFFVNHMFTLPPDPGVKLVRFSDTDPYLGCWQAVRTGPGPWGWTRTCRPVSFFP